MIVADTTLLVQYILAEEPAAQAVRDVDAAWVAPPLSATEVRSALLKYVRAGRMSVDEAIRACALAAALADRTRSVQDADVLRAAARYGLSAYDAEYVVLAQALGVRLVTSDKRVLAAVPDVAVRPDAFADAPR